MSNKGKSEVVSIVLTKPTSLEDDSNIDHNNSPNLSQRVGYLLKNVRLGSDLTHFQVPVLFNMPKSLLQIYGESVYAIGEDLLRECNRAKSPLERFICVVAWIISTTRPLIFGVSPFNPIPGETHHVSRGSLNVLLEQVSHHPPVSALHATDEDENIDVLWCLNPVPKFYGIKVEADLLGKRRLQLKNHGETYVMNSPNFYFRFLPPGVDWVGKVKISCQETSLEAELCYTTSSLFFRGKQHSIKGKICDSSSSKVLYEVNGHWNSVVKIKDTNSGQESEIYNAKDVILELKAPVVRDVEEIWPSESAVVWSEVSQNILTKNWDKAGKAKMDVEEEQRKLRKERNNEGKKWVPNHFTVSYSKEDGWDCFPIKRHVLPAPIVFPI